MNYFNSASAEFKRRHIGPSPLETQQMLEAINANSLEELVAQTIPANIRMQGAMQIPEALSEAEMLAELKKIAAKNKVFRSHIGLGYYDTFTPGVILRNILENPGWYTQYTPYQAEIAQGRLQALLNYQTLVTDLTGTEIANASLLDEATAAAEAMHMFQASKPKGQGNKFFIADTVLPQTIDVMFTRAEPLGIELVVGKWEDFSIDNSFFGALVQFPDAYGAVNNYAEFIRNAHDSGAFVVVAADLMSLILLEAPGKIGADAVIGSSQRFGVPMGYGGPHAAFFGTREQFKRDMPGRIIGVSIDAQGNPALRMALQTREQHIRREKATSNICTAQVLLSIMASMYAVYHGPKGLKDIASSIHIHTKLTEQVFAKFGFTSKYQAYFDTLSFELDQRHLDKFKAVSEAFQVNFGYHNDCLIVAIDETTKLPDIQRIADILAEVSGRAQINVAALAENLDQKIHLTPARNSDYLTHPVFNSYHSETEMLRYIKQLESKDLSLAYSMIALGSCTMKLNATTEMIPVTWQEFGALHPFAPLNQAQGYAQIFTELSDWLKQVTGFAGMSLQPNAGAQGEYTGLMVIREFFKSLGQEHRNIALIPSSAHGTNPASAVMAGMQVVVTKCDAEGNIDVADLKEKAEKYSDKLAVLMVTYPSTHGVFEETIIEVCEIIHSHGGQVYMDGANMNAQVGLTSPGLIGADVCHLNLHKTFCIPHGGGGPGMGPIGVAAHLVPFLPGHALVKTGGDQAMSAVSAAPYGSASILLISYAYIRMMGAEGLTDATRYAILNANYIKDRLEGHYKVLYLGKNGRAAHEMILDTRVFKQTAGVEVEDIAKRLMDYGFHAPTVSFPVAGTLMIEPTESESKAELDRFIEAMIGIRNEIREIEEGNAARDINVLKNAPHTAAVVLAETFAYPYSREKAVYPVDWIRNNKFWPSVARVNNTYGDRNLICTCLPIEAYETVEG